MSLTKATYSMIDGAPINVKDFGAKGDGVTDDTAAIQAAFDTILTQTSYNYNAAAIAAKKIVFPQGQYLVSGPLVIGESAKFMTLVTVEMQSANIRSSYSGAEAALTIWFPTTCQFNSINVIADGGVAAVRINNSSNSFYNDWTLGATAGALGVLEMRGVIINNTFTHMRFANQVNGADYCIHADLYTVIPPAIFAQAPINSFNGLYLTAAKAPIYWNYGSQLTFTNIEMEGFTDDGALFINCENISWEEAYLESFPPNVNSLRFNSCNRVYLKNHITGSYYHFTAFDSCTQVVIDNYFSGPIKLYGANTDFVFNNLKILASAVSLWLQQQANSSIKRLQVNNLFVRNQTDTADVGQVPKITSGDFSQADNWIKNPRALDASGDITTTYFTSVNNGSYQEVSPLGYIESVFESDSAAGFPVLGLDIDTTKIAGAKTSKGVVVVAFKSTAPAGFTAVTSTGVYSAGGQIQAIEGGNLYGANTFTVGDWLLSYALVNIDSANTKVEIVWNYNDSFPIGTKFLFGGACLYAGSAVKYPLI
jgi:hypothetical protein